MLNVEDYRTTIRQYLRSSWKNVSEEDREDIEQMALIQIHRKIEAGELGHVDDVANYARKTARNCGLDILKKRRNQVQECRLKVIRDANSDEPMEIDAPDRVDDIDLRIDLNDFLDGLTTKQRRYCQWRAEGYSDDEIAVISGISKTSLHRLRHKLEKRWAVSR